MIPDAPEAPPERRVFANRTLNLRAVKAVGFDMDYTLIHYRHELWERRAYERVVRRMGEAGWPVQGLDFDSGFATRGLVIDLKLGNLVKATRFGFVLRACHGTRLLPFEEQRRAYSRVLVDLSEPRWVFLNTLFSLSEACLYAQLVDRLDQGRIEQPVGYRDLYQVVRSSLSAEHMEGELKADIMRDPETFVVPDPDLPLALLDLKHSGKTLMLITNSDWSYTRAMMGYAFDRHMPQGRTFRDLFDVILVEARKPDFFSAANLLYEVMEDSGLLKPAGKLERGRVFHGGNARLVEAFLGVPGEEILYIGDHVYADVHVTKEVLRWRTALIVREIEDEIVAAERFKDKQAELSRLMARKTGIERRQAWLRLCLQRMELGYAPPFSEQANPSEIKLSLNQLRAALDEIDPKVAELAREAAELGHRGWGPLLHAGSDKSRMARQLESYADIYLSRVSNLLYYGPFAYLRPPPGRLPHDP